jgi:glycosyltransferase involved in cell wall biosynthesis
MNNKKIHWFEAKQIDRVTNFSTEVEVIKRANSNSIPLKYYCTFKDSKKYYGLEENITYLGVFKNKFIKAFEFQLLVCLKSIGLVLGFKRKVIIVNQNLIKNVLPAFFLDKLLKKNNKFIVDIRTTPTNPSTFDKDMKSFHGSFKLAVKYFDGFSFITTYMEKYVMDEYKIQKATVNWSSGVDVELFNPKLHVITDKNKPFRVFYHGGISESRGNLNLIKACEQLVKKGYDIELVQIGICVDSSIQHYILDNKIENWCKLLPPVPLEEIPQYVVNSDLPVLPFPNFMAWRVSSPIKLMEYLAMGKKVLAPNMEAFIDVFKKHPELIFYYDTNTSNQIDEISNRIKEIIDENLLQEVNAQQCIDFVSNEYTWKKQADKLLNFCDNL